jgi:hypothetical protein
MSKFTYSQITNYEVESLRRNINSLKEAHDTLLKHVMSLPTEVSINEFGKLSEALASIYTAQFCLNLDVETIENRPKHEL